MTLLENLPEGAMGDRDMNPKRKKGKNFKEQAEFAARWIVVMTTITGDDEPFFSK